MLGTKTTIPANTIPLTSPIQTVSSSTSQQVLEKLETSPVQSVSSSSSIQVLDKVATCLDQSASPSGSFPVFDKSTTSPEHLWSPTRMMNRSERTSSTGDALGTPVNKPGSESDIADISPSSPRDTGNNDASDIQPRRKARVKDEKVCLVCGDKALGYNFNAMTCESCKAFFRRNALKPTTASCLFQGSCQIDMRTRRFCPHCRLIKCYTVGMKKDMILDDSERKARMQKVLENRKRKMKGTDQSEEDTKTMIKEEPCEADMLPDQSDSSRQQPSNSLADTFTYKNADDSKCLRTPPGLGADGYNKDPSLFRILTPAEYILFEDLGEAYRSTLGELLQDRIVNEESYNNCNDLINHSTVAVKRLIMFIKRLEDFQKLSQEDQIAALKACVLSSLVLRSSCFYNIERDSWMTGSGEISTSILQRSTGYSELHEIHTNFCRALKEVVHDDKVLFSLIQVICIFNPDCKDVREKCKVSNLQDKYIILLKHYLEWEFSYTRARSVFSKLMTIIADMKRTSDAHNAIILQANPSDIEPLMLEVLDLKGLVSAQPS